MAQPAHTCRSLTLLRCPGWLLASGGPPAGWSYPHPHPHPHGSLSVSLSGSGKCSPGRLSCAHHTPTRRALSGTMQGKGQGLGTSPPTAQPAPAPAPCQVAPGHQMGPVPLVPPFLSPARPLLELREGRPSRLSGMGQPQLQQWFPPPQGRACQACWGQASGPGLELPRVPGGPWAKALTADPWVRRG